MIKNCHFGDFMRAQTVTMTTFVESTHAQYHPLLLFLLWIHVAWDILKAKCHNLKDKLYTMWLHVFLKATRFITKRTSQGYDIFPGKIKRVLLYGSQESKSLVSISKRNAPVVWPLEKGRCYIIQTHRHTHMLTKTLAETQRRLNDDMRHYYKHTYFLSKVNKSDRRSVDTQADTHKLQ